MYTLTQTINWAQNFIQFAPITAGLGQEPAVSTANMIRTTLTNPPIAWAWNRNYYTLASQTVKGTQDYDVLLTVIPDFGFLEKVALLDSNGKYWEIIDVYNNHPISLAAEQQRPQAACVILQTSAKITVRFIGVPNGVYTVTLIYQKKPQSFGPFLISSAAAKSVGNTVYTGVFDAQSFPAGSTAEVTGFKVNLSNNGSFAVVSCTATLLTVTQPGVGGAETISAYASNFDWAPVPDWYQDIYNNLFLSEMFTLVDDARAQMFRQRGIAAFLSKAEGLTETQKKAFVQQWLARSVESATMAQLTQLANQARGI